MFSLSGLPPTNVRMRAISSVRAFSRSATSCRSSPRDTAVIRRQVPKALLAPTTAASAFSRLPFRTCSKTSSVAGLMMPMGSLLAWPVHFPPIQCCFMVCLFRFSIAFYFSRTVNFLKVRLDYRGSLSPLRVSHGVFQLPGLRHPEIEPVVARFESPASSC